MFSKILLTIAICLPISLFSQYEKYPVLFSQQYSFGSARTIGMGSAYSSLGVDYSTVGINPAGLARSTRSAVSLSGGIYTSTMKSNYYNTSAREDEVSLNINEISIYKAIDIKDSKWRFAHFGAGYIRHRNLRSSYTVQGSSFRTLADDYANRAYGVDPNDIFAQRPFDAALAYETYVIDPYFDTATQNFYYQPNLADTATTSKDVNIRNYGHTGEFNVSFAANYNNKLYIGATIGIPRLKYEEKKTHTERTDGSPSNGIQDFTFSESVLTRGTGITFRLGMIYLPKEWLRIGASFHTPSRIVMKEQYTASMSATVDQIDRELDPDFGPPTGNFEYVITTPLKVNLSVAGIIKQKLILSLEGDYINYNMAQLKSSNDNQFSANFTTENDIIKATTRNIAFNVRAGLEYRVYKTLGLRIGYGYYQSPYQNAYKDQQSDVMTFSGGVGYRMKHFFIDLAYMRRQQSKDYYVVNPEFDEPASIEDNKNNIVLTLGYRF